VVKISKRREKEPKKVGLKQEKFADANKNQYKKRIEG